MVGSQRYAKHLPFQVFCCESGTHVVDPAQSYYAGISYRAGINVYNATLSSATLLISGMGKCCMLVSCLRVYSL